MNFFQKIFTRKQTQNGFRRVANTTLLPYVDGVQFVGNERYADIVFYSMIEVVRSALSGIKWRVDTADVLQGVRLRRLLDGNLSWIYKTLMIEGKCYIEYHDSVCRLLTSKKEADGFTVEITSNEARWGLKSKYRMLQPLLRGLDIRMNADLTLTEGLGALGILCPESGDGMVSYGEKEKEEIQREYNSAYGVTRGKWKLLITPQAVKYQPINLPIKDLALKEGIDHCIKLIAGYMRIPRELLPISTDATFANRSEAMRELREVVVPDVCNNIFDCINTVLAPIGTKVSWTDEAKQE